MINLSHIELDSLAKKHLKELRPWVKKRFDGMLAFFDTLEANRTSTTFPENLLLGSTTDITLVQKTLWTTILKPHFSDINLLNDIKITIDCLRSELDNILAGNLDELDRIVLKLDPILVKHRTLHQGKHKYDGGFKAIAKALIHVFDYKKFTVKMEESNWDAYTLASKLNVKVCPYCNRLYTNTVIKRKKKGRLIKDRKIIRSELDHFYVKAYYPFLRLSFYNLVPSCHSCNSSLKGEETMDIRHHMHPYVEGFHNVLEFRTGRTVDDFLKGKKENKSIKLIKVKGVDSDKYKRAVANSNLFELDAIYNEHKDIADEIFEKSINNPREHVKKLTEMTTDNGNKLFDNDFELYRHFVGNFMLESNFYKRPLAKFQFDISKETGLIKLISESMIDSTRMPTVKKRKCFFPWTFISKRK